MKLSGINDKPDGANSKARRETAEAIHYALSKACYIPFGLKKEFN